MDLDSKAEAHASKAQGHASKVEAHVLDDGAHAAHASKAHVAEISRDPLHKCFDNLLAIIERIKRSMELLPSLTQFDSNKDIWAKEVSLIKELLEYTQKLGMSLSQGK